EARSRTRLIVERRLREAGLGVRPAMQLTGTEAVKKAVEANLGVAFVSGFAVERELAAGALTRVEVAGLRIVRHLEMIRRAQRYVTPAAAAFHRFVREFVRHQLPRPPRAVP
ncbi:MAG: LysR substrate-binding domain-containing protein, partial [Dehalococcoidia bacterium]